MSIGSVGIVQMNNSQGAFKQPEKTFLYIGIGGENAPSGVQSVNSGSKLDSLCGTGTSNLKTQIAAAVANAGDNNFFAYSFAIGADEDYVTVVKKLLAKPVDLNVEAIVLCDPVKTNSEVAAAQTVADYLRTAYAKFVFINLCTAGIDAETQSWSAYATAIKAVISGSVADRVSVTPLLWPDALGAACGRLCHSSASISDTPMRVKTGAVTLSGNLPEDKEGMPLNMTIIKDLADNRFSVPQWYDGFDGIYWADMPLLDAEGGDFQVVEYRRIVDFLARRVRILAIRRIGDRALNSTDKSIAQNKTYFMRPLRDAAKPVTIAGVEVPALIHPPQDNDIEITWISNIEVAISITAQPFNCPKRITVYLGLDLSGNEE